MQREMSDQEYVKFKRLRRFMEEIPTGEMTVPKCCQECECYQPEWKFRTCLYAKCKYGKNINPFRDRPLSHDIIPNPEKDFNDLRDLVSLAYGW